MTRLGAKKKREREATTYWTYDPGPPLEEGEVVVFTGEHGMMATGSHRKVVEDREYTEDEVKVACEWTLVFMLMFKNTNSARFGLDCIELAMSYPMHSYRYTFWWSARNLCRKYTLEDFRSYMADKFVDIERGYLRRDGPVW